jgi:hypothetical protein
MHVWAFAMVSLQLGASARSLGKPTFPSRYSDMLDPTLAIAVALAFGWGCYAPNCSPTPAITPLALAPTPPQAPLNTAKRPGSRAAMNTPSDLPVPQPARQTPGQSRHQPTTSPSPEQTSHGPAPEPAPDRNFEDTGSDSFNQSSPEAKICSAVARRSGAPCQAYARPESAFCIFHDPAYSEDRRKNASVGGKASGSARQAKPVPLAYLDVSTPQRRAELFGYLISATLTGRISPAQSDAIHRSLAMVMRDSEEPAPFGSLRTAYR